MKTSEKQICRCRSLGVTIAISDNFIGVGPNRLGRFMAAVTFGWLRPWAVFNRDFGTMCDDGRRLVVHGRIDVTVVGNPDCLCVGAGAVVVRGPGSHVNTDAWKDLK